MCIGSTIWTTLSKELTKSAEEAYNLGKLIVDLAIHSVETMLAKIGFGQRPSSDRVAYTFKTPALTSWGAVSAARFASCGRPAGSHSRVQGLG